MNFYVDLPSNTRTGKEYVRENTSSKFRVRLPEEISLGGEPWEVALVELQYPHSWNNISSDKYETVVGILQYNQILIKSKTAGGQIYTIPEGYYSNIDLLTAAVHDELKIERDGFVIGKHFAINYDPVQDKVAIETDDEVVRIYLTPQISYILGYKDYPDGKRPPTDAKESNLHWADYPPDMTAGITSLYVYCDIVAPQIVGNVHAPLLRIVPVSGNPGEIVDRNFTAPHYVPVLNKQFSTIEININTDQDKPFAFLFGKSIVKLHFRRYRPIRI